MKKGRGFDLLKKALQLADIEMLETQPVNEIMREIHTAELNPVVSSPSPSPHNSCEVYNPNCILNKATGEIITTELDTQESCSSPHILSHNMYESHSQNYILDEATGEFIATELCTQDPCAGPSLLEENYILHETTGELITAESDTREFCSSPSILVDNSLQDLCSDDDQDPSYEPNEGDQDISSESESTPLAKKRRGIRREPVWDRNKQKILRMQGKSYKGLKKVEGKWTQTNERPARTIKNPCSCSSSKTACRKLTEEKRKEIHDKFWGQLNWGQRKVYVASLVTKILPTSRRPCVQNSRRSITLHYHLRLNEERFRVCKIMFLHTLDLGEKSVRQWSLNNQNGIPSSSITRPSRLHTERDSHLLHFLNLLPKIESHYSRAGSTKIYLEPNWDSLKDLHSFYQEVAIKENIKPYSWTHFVQELKKQNITLFQNRKDQCDTCFAFKESRVEKDEYDVHILRKNLGREEKSADKRLAEIDSSMKVYCVDVQAILLAPKVNVSLAYYKMKLKLHNFTSFDLITRNGRRFLWDEVNGGLDAEVFASLYVELIKTEYERSETPLTKIVLWSDGCGYQNRNQVVANAILKCAVDLNIIIEQKYLEHGHTFMEVDSEHSVIERKIKRKMFTYLQNTLV